MSEHDWVTAPASDCPYIICLKCDAVYDCDDDVYFRKGAYDKPPLTEDPGCSPHADHGDAEAQEE